MRRFAAFWIAVALTALFLMPAGATETTEPSAPVREPGYCGEAITWEYEDGVLTISGTGEMDDFPDGAPWQEYRDEITTVVLTGGITYIGRNAFWDYDALTWVDFGNALREIGPDAFRSCDGLTEVYLPRTFKIFGEQCFMSCKNLKEFHCEGGFPSFRWNCMWDTYGFIYFPADRPWGITYIEQMENVFKGRIEFRASDGTDPYNPTEPTEPSSEPTEPSSEPTEPSTEPTEVTKVTEAVTAPPETEESTTESPSEEPDREETEPEYSTAPPTGEEETGGMGLTGMAAAAAVVALLLLAAVVIGKINRRGKYSR